MNFTQYYKEIKQHSPINIRSIARNLVLSGLSLKTLIPYFQQYFKKPRVQFVYIHHTFKDELSKLEELLRILHKNHTFIPYSEGVNRIHNNEIDKAYLCISSDDGFKNNLDAAAIFKEFGIKACFFVNPDSVGLTDYDKIKAFCAERLNFPPTEFLNWDDLNFLKNEGHEIGSHTMGHINVAQTNINQFEDNLNESARLITSYIEKPRHFAFPYGRFSDFSLDAHKIVFKSGFQSCATAERGCHVTSRSIAPEDLFIRRDHLICDWPVLHNLYFILNSASLAHPKNNFVPYPK